MHSPLSQACMVCLGLQKVVSKEKGPELGSQSRQSNRKNQKLKHCVFKKETVLSKMRTFELAMSLSRGTSKSISLRLVQLPSGSQES